MTEARLSGTECRQMVAHGGSRGYWVGSIASPGGVKEFSRLLFAFLRRALFAGYFLPPLRGLIGFVLITHGSRRGLPSGAAPQLFPEQFAGIIPTFSLMKG